MECDPRSLQVLIFSNSYMNILHETTSLCNQIIETLSDPSIWANFFTAKFLLIKMSHLQPMDVCFFGARSLLSLEYYRFRITPSVITTPEKFGEALMYASQRHKRLFHNRYQKNAS